MRSNCKPLPRRFFLHSPTVVAPALIGKLLIRRQGGRERRARIVETEAYLGQGDAAAHAAAGLTARTAILFGEPGRAYIYLIYGMYLCLNVSTLPAGEAGGVLFRAAEEVGGEAAAGALRGALTGPGRLTRGLGIGAALNGCDLTRRGPLYLADDGGVPPAIAVTARVGIRKAVELPYRYCWAGHAAVSRHH
ncbi:MAG: DNA-3-methyladenine glycosylase [Terriglobales bacterium]